MFNTMTLFILFNIFLSPSLKITTSFANIARTTTSTSKYILGKISDHQELGLNMKNDFKF